MREDVSREVPAEVLDAGGRPALLPEAHPEGEVMEQGNPRAGCLLALGICCFFWAGVLLLVAWRWGWLW